MMLVVSVVISLLIASYFITKQNTISEETTKCIANNSKLYVQLGCSHCEKQEKLFGNYYNYLNVTDCFYETQKCIDNEITGTPTWIIKEEKYLGFLSEKELKILTNCQ